MILSIVQSDNPMLREVSVPVTGLDQNVAALAGNLVDTMRHHHALGLSAVQVGIPWRVFVVSGRVGSPWSVFINPEIIVLGGAVECLPEGCLSIDRGEVNYAVPRRTIVGIKFLDREGVERKFRTSKMLARVLQHEMDHLDGKLISDIGELIQSPGANVAEVGHG